ncbi:hypothetical protein FisN_8Lh368 [Fistulifera solaris]|uniref:Uncharacterized protein n=1 Tax=Fistulifera solaris TaxID=1519565 RepID=A0A1Z5JMY8_FISSO|nr:hypothetical protein FisN_8Lh368 [Fistulifera solaris]|eukprot:GAX15344.1 hypothetical protein FisN_8Lh368 [Fistulifera solaris]
MITRRVLNQTILLLSALLVTNGAFARALLSENEGSVQLRGAKRTSEVFNRRRLPKRPSGHGHSTSHSGYLGCLALSDSELKSSWKLSGRAPKCQYTHHAGKGNSTASGSYENSGNTHDGGSDYGLSNNDSDKVVSNGDFENVNDTVESEGNGTNENNGNGGNNANNNGNGGNNANNSGSGNNNANYNGNGGNNANNNGNGNNQNNNGNGGNNANNNGNGGNNANNNGNGNNQNNNGQDGKNSGNNGGQNQGQASFDPYGDFDVTKCDTYENLWMWDLSLTCAKDGDPSTCECIFAKEMMELGSLSCDDAVACPRNCKICSQCMKLLGCQVPRSSTFLSSTRSFLLLAIVVGFLICGVAYYTRRRRRRGPSILQKVLLEDNNSASDESTGGGRVWLAPVPSSHDSEGTSFYSYNNAAQLPIWVPTKTNGKDQKPIWLAPDASSRELGSCINAADKGEMPVWLAPDATSVQLKGPFEECEKHIRVDSAPNTPLEPVKGESKSDDNLSVLSLQNIPSLACPNHLGLKYAGLKPDTRQNDDSVRSAPDTVSTVSASQANVRCKVNEDSKDELSLGAWSYEAEDPGTTDSPRLQSRASRGPVRAPEVKYDASDCKIAPETVLGESDDDDLPSLT